MRELLIALRSLQMRNIILGVTGSVAAIKVNELASALSEIGEVRIVATSSAMQFFPKDINFPVYQDADEWKDDYKLGDPILHIELRNWASCLVIAPLGANTLAKLHNGICDNLLTCLYRAWDWKNPVVVAPAMNTMMWNNHPTGMQIESLQNRGVFMDPPVSKKLACGDVGIGAMASVESIVRNVKNSLRWQFPLEQCNGIPINHHPGAFGFHRKKNHHTGVDLYCNDGQEVVAVEDGIVVKADVFTGPAVGHSWWEETYGVMIEGASGVVNYGEVSPELKVGEPVKRGQRIGAVKRVLFEDRHRPDIPGHSTSMLHIELYKPGTRDYANWHDPQKNPDLLDPTQNLIQASNAPTNTLTWDNESGASVG